MSFSEALDAALRLKDLKARDIASNDVTESYISKLRCGRVKDPAWQKAVTIIQALGMTPDEFRELELKLEAKNKKQC